MKSFIFSKSGYDLGHQPLRFVGYFMPRKYGFSENFGQNREPKIQNFIENMHLDALF